MTNDGTARLHTHHHAVQFYGNDDSLFTTVAGFLSEGLVAGHPAIVIATPPHATAIADQLAVRLIDVDAARASGDLVLMDAQETLDLFMIDGMPHPGKFQYHIGSVIASMLDRRSRAIVRAYGEMVDVLWKQGSEDAAIRLEILWNKLATTYGFALLCGYSMGNFYKQADRFEEVCRQHTHVLAPESKVVAFDRNARAKIA